MQKDTAVPEVLSSLHTQLAMHSSCSSDQKIRTPTEESVFWLVWRCSEFGLKPDNNIRFDQCIASHGLSNSKELYIWQCIWGLKCVLTKWKWLQATYLYQQVSPTREGMLDSWFICLMIRRRLLPCSNTKRKKCVGCRFIYSVTRQNGTFICSL